MTEKTNLKTYAEMNGKEFEWLDAIEEIIETPDPISDGSMCVLSVLASDWRSCPVGNECSSIPRDEDGAPQDPLLRTMGELFGDLVEEMTKEMSWSDKVTIATMCLSLLCSIEARADQVVANAE